MVYLNGFFKGIVLKEERRSVFCFFWVLYLFFLLCFVDVFKGVDIVFSFLGRNILLGDRVIFICRVNSSYFEVSFV